MNEKQIRILGILASIMAVGMYVAYIPQIQANLAGHKGTPIQPLVACINCTLWVFYGLFKKPRDWPIVVAKVHVIILGLITFVTSLYKACDTEWVFRSFFILTLF